MSTLDQSITPGSLISSQRNRSPDAVRDESGTISFLKAQNGVLDVEFCELDQSRRGLKVWVHETSNGLPVGALPDGTVVTQLNSYETQYLYREIFVDRVYDVEQLKLGEHPVIVDAGANIGMFALFMSRALPDARIVSLEPAPHAYAALVANVQEHKIPASCLPYALGCRPGTDIFTVYPAASVFSGLGAERANDQSAILAAIETEIDDPTSTSITQTIAKTRLEGAHRVQVNLMRLRDVVTKLGISSIDVLKLDTEGNELEILSGFSPEEWGLIRNVMMEVHDPKDVTTAKALFEHNGFDCHLVEIDALQGTGFTNLYAVRRDQRGTLSANRVPLSATDSMLPLTMEQRLRLALETPLGVQAQTIPIEICQAPKQEKQTSPVVNFGELPSDLVALVRGIWCDILDVETLEDDNFFALGGSSIKAVRMLSRVRRELGSSIGLDGFNDAPSLTALVAKLADEQRERGPSSRRGDDG